MSKTHLGDLLHEDAVVALGRHAGMREADDGAELVDAQVALAAAPLPAGRARLLQQPRAQNQSGFDVGFI